MNSEKELITAISQFSRVLKRFGVKRITGILKRIEQEDIGDDNGLKQFIIVESCRKFNVRRKQLTSAYVRDDANLARMTCIILLKRHLECSHEEIARIFGRNNHLVVSHAIREFSRKDENHVIDRKFLDSFNEVSAKIEKYVNKNNNEN